MFVLISVGWNTVTQVMWHKRLKKMCLPHRPLSLSPKIHWYQHTYNWQNISFLLIYFWVFPSSTAWISQYLIYMSSQREKNKVIRIWSWKLLFIFFVKMAFWLLIGWLFVHMLDFCGRLCVLKWQTKCLRLLPFSKSCKAYFYTRQYNILYMNCWFI